MDESQQDAARADKDGISTLSKLQSSRSSHHLEQIASLRASGIGDHIDLPQLVVCGDQSAGKSSVLEGLTGLPFPRQDGVCTKFPTEIILEHRDEVMTIVATILPSPSRQDADRHRLGGYRRVLEEFSDLPDVITEVGTLMGIRGFDFALEGPAFAVDVLRIHMTGLIGMHLSVVDLPGLIAVPSEEQTEEDMQTVHDMVDSYASNPRTIILAVVQATNDIANQGIIQKARRFDLAGKRTVGIITKPDLINEGTEKRIASLAKNEDTTKLKLGFFILKNPSPTEMAKGVTQESRKQFEARFFNSKPWSELGLSPDRVGIDSLRAFLQSLLDQHIERELPKVRSEIKELMRKTEQDIVEMGIERPSTAHMRMFLSRLAMQFHGLIIAGLHGNYHETSSEFFDIDGTATGFRRLRAVVHHLNTDFSDHLRENGQKRKIAENGDSESIESAGDVADQILVSEAGMKAWVREIYRNSRGRELPGNYNHILLSELFHVQSSRWLIIARDHVSAVYDKVYQFVKAALSTVSNDERIFSEIMDLVETKLERNQRAAQHELDTIWEDETRQPITYNHYYTDNVQRSRQDKTGALIKKAMKDASVEEYHGKMHISNNTVDAEKLLASLQRRVIVDMDEQACTEALAGLQAYYKVARKTFVDNVCKQVIERHLLRNLHRIFDPETVATLSDSDLQRIAAEVPAAIERRKMLGDLLKRLQKSVDDLRR